MHHANVVAQPDEVQFVAVGVKEGAHGIDAADLLEPRGTAELVAVIAQKDGPASGQRGTQRLMSTPPAAQFWIGPSGWSYPDWYGTVYPRPKPRGFKPLRFLGIRRFFLGYAIRQWF